MRTPSKDPGCTWGPVHLADGSIQFCLWAPAERHVSLVIEGQPSRLALTAHADGWHSVTTTRARIGSRYQFQLGDGTVVPDPASRFQPENARGPSEVIDPAFQWRDRSWRGLPWQATVIQEVHTGAYTPSGTFAALAAKIPHLADLGITALQLMPISDSVLPYAPSATYGRPKQLKALVDKAHDYGLMVFLDVAYRALGPESEPTRRFITGNALCWLEEFHVDGLRLDSAPLREELAQVVHDRFPQRHVHLMLAREKNEAAGTHSPSALVASLASFDPNGKLVNRSPLVGPASQTALRAASAIRLLLPQIPLLFMGEEWDAAEEPVDRAALENAKLDWSSLRQPDGTAAFERYQTLLAIRRNEVSPRLPSITQSGRIELSGTSSFRIEWAVGESELLVLEANLSAHPGHVTRKDIRRILWTEGECSPGRTLPPWAVLWGIRGAG